MRQFLGPKKIKRLERIIGREIDCALVRGGSHGIQVWFPKDSPDGDIPHLYLSDGTYLGASTWMREFMKKD